MGFKAGGYVGMTGIAGVIAEYRELWMGFCISPRLHNLPGTYLLPKKQEVGNT